jgi:hypothetical protein
MSLRDRAEVTEYGFFQKTAVEGRRSTVGGRRSAAPSEPKSLLSHLRNVSVSQKERGRRENVFIYYNYFAEFISEREEKCQQ